MEAVALVGPWLLFLSVLNSLPSFTVPGLFRVFRVTHGCRRFQYLGTPASQPLIETHALCVSFGHAKGGFEQCDVGTWQIFRRLSKQSWAIQLFPDVRCSRCQTRQMYGDDEIRCQFTDVAATTVDYM